MNIQQFRHFISNAKVAGGGFSAEKADESFAAMAPLCRVRNIVVCWLLVTWNCHVVDFVLLCMYMCQCMHDHCPCMCVSACTAIDHVHVSVHAQPLIVYMCLCMHSHDRIHGSVHVPPLTIYMCQCVHSIQPDAASSTITFESKSPQNVQRCLQRHMSAPHFILC